MNNLKIVMRGVVFSALLGVGCTGTGEVEYSGSVETPDLVDAGDGVQVVADYDEPVFFSDGFYWRHNDDGWYRSNNYAGGFVHIDAPPARVGRINQPERFTHYKPTNYTAHHRATKRPEPIGRVHAAR